MSIANCYGHNSMVCLSLCWSLLSSANVAEPVKMPFGRTVAWAQGTMYRERKCADNYNK